MFKLNRKAQSLSEYAIAFGIILAMIFGMKEYVTRALAKKTELQLSAFHELTYTPQNLQQYEPYYQHQTSDDYSTSNQQWSLTDEGEYTVKTLTPSHMQRNIESIYKMPNPN